MVAVEGEDWSLAFCAIAAARSGIVSGSAVPSCEKFQVLAGVARRHIGRGIRVLQISPTRYVAIAVTNDAAMKVPDGSPSRANALPGGCGEPCVVASDQQARQQIVPIEAGPEVEVRLPFERGETGRVRELYQPASRLPRRP